MKKICVITTVHNPFDARIFYRECLSLAKKYEVTLVAQHEKEEVVQKVRIVPLPKTKVKLARFMLGYTAVKKAMEQKADVYHFHDFEFLFWGRVLKTLSRKPVIYDAHEFFDMVVDTRPWAKGWRKPIIKSFIAMYHRLSKKFDAVFVASPLQAESYKSSTVLLNVPPVENFKNVSLEKSYKKIAYVGSITKDRVSAKVGRIADGLSGDFKICLVGRVVDDVKNKKIEKTGFVPNSKITSKLSGYGVGFVPMVDKMQYHVSIPSKVFDYMAMGMIVVAPNFIKESFGGIDVSKNIIFVEDSPESFATALTEIATDTKKAKAMSKKNREDFLANFSWGAEEEKMFKVYKELL